MSTRLIALALALTCSVSLEAQAAPALQGEHAGWRHVIHYGKWITAAAAATFTAMGAHEHANSNRAFRGLLDLCQADVTNCLLAPDGRYRDPAAEALYQTSIHYDGRARLRLLIGQVSLLGTAALFLADHHHPTAEPGNIPFHGAKVMVEPERGGASVGVRLTLP
jgi:hypothetical protein